MSLFDSVKMICRKKQFYVAAFLFIFASRGVLLSILNWKSMRGWEAYWIAQAIASGKGFSFPSAHRWLFDLVNDGGFHPTAWIDPIYTSLLASMIWVFGDYHQLAAAIFNFILFGSVFIFTYLIAEKLINSNAAVFSVFILSLSNFSTGPFQMNNTYLAASLICLSSVMIIWFWEKLSRLRACIIGFVLGLTVLTCPSAQFFIPIAILCIIYFGRNAFKQSFIRAALLAASALLIMSPWVVRNYFTFNEFIPTRNGAGQIAFVGTVATGAVVNPDTIDSRTKPGWTSQSPKAAVHDVFKDSEKLLALERFQLEYAKEVAPSDWVEKNEAQRDKWFLGQTLSYISKNPFLTIQLGIAKLKVFARIAGRLGTLVFIFMLLGVFVIKGKPALIILFLCGFSYIAPFFLIISYYGRYRQPIEAVLILLATSTIFIWLQKSLGPSA